MVVSYETHILGMNLMTNYAIFAFDILREVGDIQMQFWALSIFSVLFHS